MGGYLCVWVVHLKVGHDDRHGQRHSEHPAQGAQRPHKHPQIRLRHHVAVAHRCHCHEGPPQAQRDRIEVVVRVGLDALGIVDKRREDNDAKDEKEDEQHELLGRGAKRLEQDLEAGRVAGQLEEPEDADDGKEFENVGVLQVGGQLSKHQVNVETE